MKARLAAGIAAFVVVCAFAGSADASTLIRTVAGTGSFHPTPDGTLATQADLDPGAIAALRAGTTPKDDFVVYDQVSCAIRRVSARTHTISTVAGGDCGFDPSGPYINANPVLIGIGAVQAIAATADNGGFLFSHDGWVEKWDPASATVTTVAGIPSCHGNATPANVGIIDVPGCPPILGLAGHPTDPSRYLVEATTAVFEGTIGSSPMALAAGCAGTANTLLCPGGQTPQFEGVAWIGSQSFVVSDLTSESLWRVFRTGAVAPDVLAGGGDDPNGEGGPGTSADLERIYAVVPGYDGSLYFTELTVVTGGADCRILRLSATDGTGVLSRIAGLANVPAAVPLPCDVGTSVGDTVDEATKLAINSFWLAMTPQGLLAVDAFGSRVRLIERTSIVSGPPKIETGWTNLGQGTFKIQALDLNPDIQCVWIGGGTTTCSTDQVVPAASDGYQFLIAGEGNPPSTNVASSSWIWKNDLHPPNPFDLEQPAAGADHQPAQPSFTFAAASDPDVVYGVDATGHGSEVAAYELWIDDHKAATGPCCTLQPSAGLAEGAHTWFVRAVDAAGNSRSSSERTFTSGGNSPVASFSIAPNPALAGRSVAFTSTSSDPDGGSLSKVEWDLDGDGTYESSGESTSRTYDQPGAVNVGLRVTDPTGLTGTTTQELKVNAVTISGQFGVTVNNGAQYTRSADVTISANFPSSISQLLVSNDGGFLAGTPIQPAKTFSWKLDSSGPERLPKIVYVRFLTSGITSETYTDDIILDETPPKVEQARISRAAGAAASIARTGSYAVKVKATDSNSGVAKLQVTAGKKRPGKLLAYKTKLKVKSAKRPKFIRAQDRAGNFSKWKTLR